MRYTREQYAGWSGLKKFMLLCSFLVFLGSSFLYLTPPGGSIREFLAQTVISTQHRDWAWIFVGAEKRDYMVRQFQAFNEWAGSEEQNLDMIQHETRPSRSLDSLVKVEDISGKYWVGKKMYVYDPKTIRVMVPHKQGEGERITSMVQRTGAVAGVNGGGFVDPDGLGNGFAPIGLIMSGGDLIYTDREGHEQQMVVGFDDRGTLVIGNYSIVQLQEMHVSEAVSFYPRVIVNGKPLITSGDGGWGRGPRTAVGQKADGTVIFIVIDGRQPHSVGATLREVQDLLLEEGCVNAGFLDGGASSEMVYNGQLITKPSSRWGERRLPSAFLIYDHPEDVKVDRIWDGLDKIDPGGAYDHPDYLRELEQQKAQQKAQEKSSPAAGPPKSAPAAPAAKPKTPAAGTASGKAAESSSGSQAGTRAQPESPAGGSAPSPAGPAAGGSGSAAPAGETAGTPGAGQPPAPSPATQTGPDTGTVPPVSGPAGSSGTSAGGSAGTGGSSAGGGGSAVTTGSPGAGGGTAGSGRTGSAGGGTSGTAGTAAAGASSGTSGGTGASGASGGSATVKTGANAGQSSPSGTSAKTGGSLNTGIGQPADGTATGQGLTAPTGG
jgi:exopolysaccharide biosynthesis protein